MKITDADIRRFARQPMMQPSKEVAHPKAVEDTLTALVTAHEMIEASRRRRDRLVRELFEAGVGATEIARALGVTRRAVYFMIDEK